MKTARISPLQNPVVKTISVPGSKSYTNRALILAALTRGKVVIKNPLFSDDTVALITCLKTLGVAVSHTKNEIVVSGDISKVVNKEYLLDCNLSGTSMRFLLALCCIIPGTKILTGRESLLKRPIKDLVDALTKLGANIEYLGNIGYSPVKITSSRLTAKNVAINGSISSQFLSALLMISPIVGITITVNGELISKPYVAMTIDVLQKFGVTVENKNFEKFIISKQVIKAKEFTVEGDFSSACYFAAIAALTKSEITIQNISGESLQADKEFFLLLEKMGNKVIFEKNRVIIKGNGVKPITVDMKNCPDQIQTLSVLAAFAHGKTHITGAQSLVIKETNRLEAIKQELEKMGIPVEITKKSITIFGRSPKEATIDTYNDHRMAMAFAVAASKLSGMRIQDADVVNKTFPDFWKKLQTIGMDIIINDKSAQKIVLIGFMGAGKSTLAPLLAKRLKADVVEMDEKVIEISGQNSIKEIFEKFGEKKFRELEKQIAKKLSNKNTIVISAGGGVVENKETMDFLRQGAFVVYLQTNFETILNRLINTQDRPLWKDQQKTKKLFQERLAKYEAFADITITTDGKSLGFITNEVQEALATI